MDRIRRIVVQEYQELNASKWLDCQVLLEVEELKSLFNDLKPFFLFSILGIMPEERGRVLEENIIDAYAVYIQHLKSGRSVDELLFREAFTCLMTAEEKSVCSVITGKGRHIIRPWLPSIIVKPHKMVFSRDLGCMQSSSLGSHSISWGLHFSFPQMYEHPETHQVEKCFPQAHLPNAQLFHNIQKWMRLHTSPTPFEIDGKSFNCPARIGKQCFEWISKHPDLVNYNFNVPVKN